MDQGAKSSRLLVLIGVIVVVAALYFAKAVLVLFAIAFLLAFLLAPLVHKIQRLGLPRIASVVIVMAFALSITVGVGWIVVNQFNDLVKELPQYRENLREKFSVLRETLGNPLSRAKKTVAEITSKPETAAASSPAVKVVDPGPTELEAIAKPVAEILDVVGIIGIVILLTAVMLIQKEDMRDRLIRLAGGGQ